MAAYLDEDSSNANPVAWAMLYGTREVGSLYTLEPHRRKGLGLAVMAALCRGLVDDSSGIPPYCLIEEDNIRSKGLVTKLGFVYTGYEAYCIEKE